MDFKTKISSRVVDLLCIATIAGIWPRYVEPKRIKKTHLRLDLKRKELEGLKIIHLTDLHFHAGTSPTFLQKIAREVNHEKCDILVFTGDFLCYSKMEKRKELKEFLQSLSAREGKFCIFGNHDYSSYVSRNREGNYTNLPPAKPLRGLYRGMRAIFEKTKKGVVSEETKAIPHHSDLCALLKESGFQLIENTSHVLARGLNLVGLGEYALGRCLPKVAFANYNRNYPGIVLAHNPDSLPLLLDYPGELILSGHTHGEQIHFPFPPFLRRFSQKLTRLENPEYSRGLYQLEKKKLYVNRGLGCHKPIRLFSPPEILVITVGA